MKDTALNAPQYVAVSYNDPANEGFFNVFHDFHTNAPYFIEEGDLNNDGRPDVVIVDDFSDRYRFNTGVDALGRVVWSSSKTFQFLQGSDDGFGGNALIVDLDNDGWDDVIVTDVDVDISGCNRRTHIYHNPGGTVGSTSIQPVEEREKSGGGGWLGVVGLKSSDLTGTHDVAVFDLDRDGDLEMILGRCSGTFVWENKKSKGFCQKNIGLEGPGKTRLTMCGTELFPGGKANLRLQAAPPFVPTFVAISFANNPTQLFGGTVVTFPADLVIPEMTGPAGGVTIADIPGGGGPAFVYAQALTLDPDQPQGVSISNAIEAEFLP